jgi:hypothetical protein
MYPDDIIRPTFIISFSNHSIFCLCFLMMGTKPRASPTLAGTLPLSNIPAQSHYLIHVFILVFKYYCHFIIWQKVNAQWVSIKLIRIDNMTTIYVFGEWGELVSYLNFTHKSKIILNFTDRHFCFPCLWEIRSFYLGYFWVIPYNFS